MNLGGGESEREAILQNWREGGEERMVSRRSEDSTL